jgi:hypothetical protein
LQENCRRIGIGKKQMKLNWSGTKQIKNTKKSKTCTKTKIYLKTCIKRGEKEKMTSFGTL